VTLHAIGRLSALQELDLGESDALDDTGLLPLRHLTALRVLGLQRCRWIGDAGCRALAQVGVGLRTLADARGREEALWLTLMLMLRRSNPSVGRPSAVFTCLGCLSRWV
jgi:hypothetical protein